jgi:hypothetical protein
VSIQEPPPLRSTVIFTAPKRIEHHGSKAGDIAIIACHERQAIDHGSRREQAVDDRDRPDGAHASPLVGDCIVDTEHATIERGLNLPKPPFERRSFVRISWARKLHCFADLPKNERAQKEILVGN